LALDESKNTSDLLITSNDVDILLGDDIRRYAETDAPITIDYKESRYGAGFVVDNGMSC
jgi:Fe-S cluster assembly iron-binding protein IscA